MTTDSVTGMRVDIAPRVEYSFRPGSDNALPIVSLDPRHTADEQKKICLVIENRQRDFYDDSRLDEARDFIEESIRSLPEDWKPVQEREDCVVRAFWNESEALAFQRLQAGSDKPTLWGVPSLSRLYYLLGGVYSRGNRLDLAHGCLRKCLELEPDRAHFWMAKGYTLNWEDRFEEALEAFRTGATICSWAPPWIIAKCLHGQGVALGALHRLIEARDAFTRALEVYPDYGEAKRDLGRVLQDLWQIQKREVAAPSPAYVM